MSPYYGCLYRHSSWPDRMQDQADLEKRFILGEITEEEYKAIKARIGR